MRWEQQISKLVCTSVICSGVMVSLFRSVSCASVADGSCRGTYRSRDEGLSARKKAHSALAIVRRMFSCADAKSRTSPTDSAFAGVMWKTYCPPDAQ